MVNLTEQSRKYDEDSMKKDFDTINNAIDDILTDMKNKGILYAMEGFEWWLDNHFDGSTPPSWKGLVENLADFLNEYYNPEKRKYFWGVVLCGGCYVRSESTGPERGSKNKLILVLKNLKKVSASLSVDKGFLIWERKQALIFCVFSLNSLTPI